MRLSSLLLLLAFSAMAYGATVGEVEDLHSRDLTREDDEYNWRQKVGRALEKVGQWLQGKYAAETEEEREQLELLNAQLQQLAADIAEELLNEDNGQLDDEAAAYGWGKWRRRITGAVKKVAQAVAINKIAGAIGGGIG